MSGSWFVWLTSLLLWIDSYPDQISFIIFPQNEYFILCDSYIYHCPQGSLAPHHWIILGGQDIQGGIIPGHQILLHIKPHRSKLVVTHSAGWHSILEQQLDFLVNGIQKFLEQVCIADCALHIGLPDSCSRSTGIKLGILWLTHGWDKAGSKLSGTEIKLQFHNLPIKD